MEGDRIDEIRKDLLGVRQALRHARGVLAVHRLQLDHNDWLLSRSQELTERALAEVRQAQREQEVRHAS